MAGSSVDSQKILLVNAAGTAIQRPNIYIPLNAIAINAEATLWTPTSGKKFRLMGGYVTITGAVANVQLKDGNGGTVFLVVPLQALAVVVPFDLLDGYVSTAANNNLRALGAASSVISGYLYGREE